MLTVAALVTVVAGPFLVQAVAASSATTVAVMVASPLLFLGPVLLAIGCRRPDGGTP